jgi:SHAQKYF class myb-like DNA-binding protein
MVESRPVLTPQDLNNCQANLVVMQVTNPTSPHEPQPQSQAGGLLANNFKPGRWTQEEHERFLRGFELYGHKWRKVRDVVGTRTVTQVRTHAQKFFVKLKKQSTMEKPTIITPHKNSPRPMLPSLRKDITIKTQKVVGSNMGEYGNWGQPRPSMANYEIMSSQQQLKQQATNPPFVTNTEKLELVPPAAGFNRFDFLLQAAEKIEAGSSSETAVRSY